MKFYLADESRTPSGLLIFKFHLHRPGLVWVFVDDHQRPLATRSAKRNASTIGQLVAFNSLVVLANGHILSNSTVRLESAADNVAATEPTVAPAGFATVHLGAEEYRVLTAPVVAWLYAKGKLPRAGLIASASLAESGRKLR